MTKRDTILKLYKSGMSQPDIRKKFGCSKQYVSAILTGKVDRVLEKMRSKTKGQGSRKS